MKCYCGHPKSMHDSDGDERQEKFWCNGKDCDCGRFIPFRESRPTPLAPDRAKRAAKSKPSAGENKMNVSELRKAIENLPNDMPVFFRRVAPVAGNIETAGSANKDTFSSFGVVQDCLIIEPITDDDDDEAQQPLAPDVAERCDCGEEIRSHGFCWNGHDNRENVEERR